MLNAVNPSQDAPMPTAGRTAPTGGGLQRTRPTSLGRLWVFRYREARAHAVIVATILWALAAVLVFTGSGYRSFTGRLKGTDFVHFYTLGHLALIGDSGRLYDPEGQHAVQVNLVPESDPEWYFPVYPPQVALVFAPLARWSYGTAAVLWGLVTITLYALVVWLAWRPSRTVLPDRWFVVAAAAAFAPFWNLVLHGQTTIVPLVAFCLGWLALERRHRFLAGLAFGLLMIKPQYGIVLAGVVLARREWAMLAGAVVSMSAQVAAVSLLLDPSAVLAYAHVLPRVVEQAYALEPKPYQMHSLRALTNLLPSSIGTWVWGIVSLGVIWQTVRVWRIGVPVVLQLAALVLASVLVSPHATIYDATLLVLPLLWVGGWIQATPERQAQMGRMFWPTVYWLCVALLMPTAMLFRVQASVLLMVFLLVQVTGHFNGSRPSRLALANDP